MNRLERFYEVIALLALLYISELAGCGKACSERDIYFVGMVTDTNLLPIADAQVVFHGEVNDSLLTVTGIDGTYSAKDRAGASYSGASVKFVKTGYQIEVSEPFLISEAGPDICGDITLRRDAILQP